MKEACSLEDCRRFKNYPIDFENRTGKRKEKRKREKFISVRGNSIVKILNFLLLLDARSRATKRVTLFTSTWFLTRAVLFIPFPFSPFHEGELRRGGSPRITQEILRRGPILIDPLIPPRFNSAPRASFLTKTFHLSIPPYFFFLFFPFFFLLLLLLLLSIEFPRFARVLFFLFLFSFLTLTYVWEFW